MEKINYLSKTYWPIVAIAIINFLLHIILYDKLEFHRDELLYFSLGMHLDAGYASIPPVTAWIATIMQSIFGYTLFAAKLYPAILGAVFILLVARIAKELGGGTYAQILTSIALLIMPVMIRTFHLFQPVCTDMFMWTVVFYLSLRFVNSDKNKYLLLIGLVGGIGLMNKYMILLLLLCMLVALATSQHRSVYTKKHFYLGLLLCTLVFAPNLIWQFMHDMPVFDHMAELQESQLVNVSRMNILTDQIMMSFASFFLIVLGVFSLLKDSKYRYVAICSLLVMCILLYLRGKSYYSIGIFPVLTAGGAVAIEKYFSSKIVRWVLPIIMILLTLPILPLGMPIYGQDGMVSYFSDLENDFDLILGRRFEDGTIHSLPQDYADQIGWEELTKHTATAYEKIPDKSKAKIYASNYGQAGAIAVIGKKYSLPEPLSFSDSFYYWISRSFEPDIEYLIYINDEMGENVAALFQEIEEIGQISNPNAREYGTTVYLCSQPRSSFNVFWKGVLNSIEEE